MEGSPLKLRQWLLAVYHLTSSPKGISSVQLAKLIGTTQKTSWFMLHLIREASVNQYLREFSESVDANADETFIADKESN